VSEERAAPSRQSATPARQGAAPGGAAREWLAYRGYAGAEWLGTRLSERTGRRLFGRLAGAAHRLLPGVRATVARNQSFVLGAPPSASIVRAATREAFDLYARYWLDTFRIRTMADDEFSKRFHFDGLENIDRALAAGHGVVTALPHMGNWDAAGHALSILGYRIAAVAEELRPPQLTELFLEHRRELGMHIVPLSENGRIGRQLGALLRDNWVLALIADRALSGRGIEVEMFGERRTLPSGPAMLSISSGAPLLVCPTYTTDDGWRCNVGPPIEVERTGSLREDARALTRRMAEEFERAIAARPVDWHMFQPAFG
jgi:phosphatidylinositol dimannoside acyltransferase